MLPFCSFWNRFSRNSYYLPFSLKISKRGRYLSHHSCQSCCIWTLENRFTISMRSFYSSFPTKFLLPLSTKRLIFTSSMHFRSAAARLSCGDNIMNFTSTGCFTPTSHYCWNHLYEYVYCRIYILVAQPCGSVVGQGAGHHLQSDGS